MPSITEQLKICAVQYLNTKPLLYGLLQSPLAQQINLELAIPSRCAELLETGQADIGLVPVAAIPDIPGAQIFSDYCIGSTGAVATVNIYGEVPIEQMEAIYLDHHSRTSAALTQVLLEEYWGLRPKLLPAQAGYIDQIAGKTGGLVIGDRTMNLADRFAYTYDLSTYWKKHTGLDFVFAAWVTTRPLSAEFITAFNTALRQGIDQIEQLMYLLPSPSPDFDLRTYFTEYISYELDDSKRRGLERFLVCLEELETSKLGV